MAATTKVFQQETEIPVQAYTICQMAEFYGVTTKTFKRWLLPFKQEIGQRIGHYYTPKQVRIIFKHLDRP